MDLVHNLRHRHLFLPVVVVKEMHKKKKKKLVFFLDRFRHPFKLNNACCALTSCGRTASPAGQVSELQVAALAVDARKATVTEADNIRSILMFGKIKYLCKVVSNKAEQEEQQAQNEKEKKKKETELVKQEI